MKKSIFTLLLIGVVVFSTAQETPRFAKYPISSSGCYAYFPAKPGSFKLEKSEDSLNIYSGEAKFGTATYSIILVDLGNTFAESSKEELAALLTQYLDYLQSQFKITGATGYGMGHTLESNPNATGVIDFWEDGENNQYDVKAWADNSFLAVLIVISPEEINYNYKSMFLNGFRFPE